MCILTFMATWTPGQRAAAEKFKAARVATGLSQRRFAEAAGVAIGVVQNFEAIIDDRDYATWPDDIRRAKLELAAGLPAGELKRIAGTGVAPTLTARQAQIVIRHQEAVRSAALVRLELLREKFGESLDPDVLKLVQELEDLLYGKTQE